MCPPSISTRNRVLARACVTTPSTSSASSFCFAINTSVQLPWPQEKLQSRGAEYPHRLQLAESYNPSIGVADRSSENGLARSNHGQPQVAAAFVPGSPNGRLYG